MTTARHGDAPLEPAPRPVPAGLRLRVLFGGLLPTIAWGLLTMAAPMAVVLVGNSEIWTAGRFEASSIELVTGTVHAVRPAAYREHNRDSHTVAFTYQLNGHNYDASSYTLDSPPAIGSRVPVEVVRATPSLSRIRGMRTHAVRKNGALASLIPLPMLLIVALGMLRGRAHLRAMRHDEAATAEVVEVTPSDPDRDTDYWFDVTVCFVDRHGNEHTRVLERVRWSTRRRGKVVLLHDRNRDDARIVATLPGRPNIRDARWAAPALAAVARSVALPTITVALSALATQLTL